MRPKADDDPALEELTTAGDSEELCRLLLRSPWGWGSSARHQEAVSLLCGLRGRGTLPGSLVALLLCTCHRWDRVTAKLIAAIEDCGVLSGPDLDELAESLLSDEVVAVFPLAWVSRRWMEFDTADGTTRTVRISDDTMTRGQRRLEPRCAAGPPPGRCATILRGLTACSSVPAPCHRATVMRCCTAWLIPRTAWRRAAPPAGRPGAAQWHRPRPQGRPRPAL
jgi:hypothetical protein